MKKQLSEMSLEELWELFPIILKDYNPEYRNWFGAEKQNILNHIKASDIARINHIGSTAVKGLIAKPTVDILLELDGCCNITHVINDLKANGWTLMMHKNNPPQWELCKGYTPEGFAEKVYHLHVRYLGNWNELYFRDYLLKHPATAADYGYLKIILQKEFRHNRDAYTAAKSDFIIKYSHIAKHEFQKRYKPK